MSSDRLSRRALLIGLMGLAGCGFVPIYGTDSGLRGQVAYETDRTVAGFRLRERLQDRLGRSAAPVFVLRVKAQSRQRAAAITSAGDTTRLNIIGTADWSLVNAATGAVVDRGEVSAFTSYAATGSTIATQATRDDAEARLAIILADQIVSRLLALGHEATQ